MQEIRYQELEQQVTKLTYIMLTRDRSMSEAMIEHLKTQLALQDVAGVVLVSLEQLLWQDAVAFCWAVQHLVPADIKHEIRQITSLALCKRLVQKGLLPGQHFSIDAKGEVLLGELARGMAFN